MGSFWHYRERIEGIKMYRGEKRVRYWCNEIGKKAMNEYVVNYLKKDIEGYYFDKRNNEYKLKGVYLWKDKLLSLVNAFAFGRSFSGFYGNRDLCSIHSYLITEIRPECFHRTLCKVCSAIHQSKQHTVYLNIRIDILLYFWNGLHKLCHTLCRQILSLNRNDNTVCRR